MFLTLNYSAYIIHWKYGNCVCMMCVRGFIGFLMSLSKTNKYLPCLEWKVSILTLFICDVFLPEYSINEEELEWMYFLTFSYHYQFNYLTEFRKLHHMFFDTENDLKNEKKSILKSYILFKFTDKLDWNDLYCYVGVQCKATLDIL